MPTRPLFPFRAPHPQVAWAVSVIIAVSAGCYRLLPNAVVSPAEELRTATPSPTSRDILERTVDYRQWPNFPENMKIERSKMHREMYVLAFHNDVVTQAMEKRTLPLPDGAIIVKENYAHASDAGPKVLTIMAKENGAWYWLESTPDGRVVKEKERPLEGYDVGGCRSCHTHAENDFVFTHEFR